MIVDSPYARIAYTSDAKSAVWSIQPGDAEPLGERWGP